MRYEVRAKNGRVIGWTDDYATAAQFYAGGYVVSGFNGPEA